MSTRPVPSDERTVRALMNGMGLKQDAIRFYTLDPAGV